MLLFSSLWKIQSNKSNLTGGHTRVTILFNIIAPFQSDKYQKFLFFIARWPHRSDPGVQRNTNNLFWSSFVSPILTHSHSSHILLPLYFFYTPFLTLTWVLSKVIISWAKRNFLICEFVEKVLIRSIGNLDKNHFNKK